MSLNFNFEDMIERVGREEYDRLTDHPLKNSPKYGPKFKDKWHPVTDALIWITMAIDMPTITEKTIDEFIERLAILQVVHGPYMTGEDGQFWITAEDVRNHIGLRTNVYKTSRAAFNSKMARAAMEIGRRRMDKDKSAFETCLPKGDNA